jgi:predicted amidohydrolase
MENSDKLETVLIQTSLFWESPEMNRSSIAKQISLLKPSTDIIILPEMFTTGFTMTPQHIDSNEVIKTISWLKELASKTQASILGSHVHKEGTAYYNRLLFVQPDGRVDHYDKRHTFTLAGEDRVYNSGTERLLIDYKGFKICPLICYDLRFPVWSRNNEDYDVLIYVANWPEPRIEAWDTLLKARAIENMAYCIGVNRIGKDALGNSYCGHSAVYDSLGKQIIFSDQEQILEVSLSKEHLKSTRNQLKFLDDQDKFSLQQ